MKKSANKTLGLSSSDRLLAVLGLFTTVESEWTVEAAAARLEMSSPTTYRYFRSLARVGLISPISRASYVLGPAIIELDRLIRLRDPLLSAGREVMSNLVQHAAEGATIVLCRAFRDRVICIHQVPGHGPHRPVSYERGRPMQLFRGATSKIILAYLPGRKLKSLYAQHSKEVGAAGLGDSWATFKKSLLMLRRAGVCVTESEIDVGRVGIAAPIFDKEGNVFGSLTFVLPVHRADENLVRELSRLTIAAAREIGQGMVARELPAANADVEVEPADFALTGSLHRS